jgi:hypothetical protein
VRNGDAVRAGWYARVAAAAAVIGAERAGVAVEQRAIELTEALLHGADREVLIASIGSELRVHPRS